MDPGCVSGGSNEDPFTVASSMPSFSFRLQPCQPTLVDPGYVSATPIREGDNLIPANGVYTSTPLPVDAALSGRAELLWM